jgi:hypothetical protein
MNNTFDALKSEFIALACHPLLKNNQFNLRIRVHAEDFEIINSGDELLIRIDLDNDKIIKYQFHFLDNYLADCLENIREEAKNRGLDFFSVEKMRLEILDDLKSVTISQLDVATILGFTNCLLVFQYLHKHILRNLALPKSIWFSEDEAYHLWHEEHRLHPIIAGQLDGLIDEIIALPSAIFRIYELYFTNGTKDKITSQSINLQQYNDLLNDTDQINKFPNEEIRMHNSVQTIISVTFLMNLDAMHLKFKQE